MRRSAAVTERRPVEDDGWSKALTTAGLYKHIMNYQDQPSVLEEEEAEEETPQRKCRSERVWFLTPPGIEQVHP